MREIISLNEGWTLRFPKGERAAETVTLPHTWNAVDGMDGKAICAPPACTAAPLKSPCSRWPAAACMWRCWQLRWMPPSR